MSDSIIGEFKLSPALTPKKYIELCEYCQSAHREAAWDSMDHYCPWDPGEDGERLAADDSEEHRDAARWLQKLIDVFFDRWGTSVTGTVDLNGDYGDYKICVAENKVLVAKGWIEYGPFEPLGKETA